MRLGEETIGFLRIGQVLRRSAIQSDKKRAAAKLAKCGVPFTGDIRKSWEDDADHPEGQIWRDRAVVDVFCRSNSRPSSTKSCLKIRTLSRCWCAKRGNTSQQHKMEPLSLATVAQASGASVFHFCKVFKKATGLKFTDYVARVRLEDAKTQLLNPSRRISEIAYDVGFQSLDAIQPHVQTSLWSITDRISRAPNKRQATIPRGLMANRD